MLDSIDIREFRGIRKCDSPLDLSEFTVIVGRNNSGKSSVLEAISCIRKGSNPLFGMMHSNFIQNLHSGKSLAYRYSGSAELRFSYEGEPGVTSVSENIKSNQRPSGLSANAILFPSSDTYIDRAYSQLQQRRADIEKEDGNIRVVEFLNESIGDRYTEVYLETLEVRKQPEDGNAYWVDILDLGSGLVQTIPIIMSIDHYKPERFLWDDMGTSLHPGLLKRVIEWLSDSEPQIVISTHSIDVLSALLEVRPEGASILQLSKTEDDVLHHTHLDIEELELMMENAGHDPRFLAEQMEI